MLKIEYEYIMPIQSGKSRSNPIPDRVDLKSTHSFALKCCSMRNYISLLSTCMILLIYTDAAIPTSGLMNLGSTCFFNAVLQALASCPSFCSWIDMRPLLPERNRRFIELLKLMINGK